MKACLIFNQFAANQRSGKFIEELESKLSDNGIVHDLFLTKSSEEAIKTVRDINFDHYDSIITAGGDGTLFSLINGYMQNHSQKRIPVCIIPTGTGNAFARDLGFKSQDIETCFNSLTSNRTKKVDIGRIKTENRSFYFANIVGLGFVTDVAKTAHGLKMFGSLSYTLGVLYHTIFLKSFSTSIKHDNKDFNDDVNFIEISNTRYTGKDFLMAPNAKINDGLLDITIMKNAGRIKLLSGLPKIFTGKHVDMKEVESFQASKIEINTNEKKILTPDGEILGSTPIQIDCLKEAIEFYTNII